MFRRYTVKLYPTAQQASLLDKQLGCCRWVYNEMIRINQKAYHRRGKTLSAYDMQSYLPKLKKQYPWLAEGNSHSLQLVCQNLADAYARFFRKEGRYPRFKKKGESDRLTATRSSRFEGNRIRLPKVGRIRYRGGKMPEGEVKRFTVKKIAGSYYASALIEVPSDPLIYHAPETILGLDLGITDLIVMSTGHSVRPPKYSAHGQKELRVRQQALRRRQKNSKRRQRARLAVARWHKKVNNQRMDFNHKLARRLVDGESQAFAVESLNIAGMAKNRNLAKHIADCGWGQILRFLRYKAEAVGKQVIEVDRWFPSSKTCSACGVVRQSLPLSIREWQCSDCGTVHQRDVNAAVNIALEAARNVARGGGVKPSVMRPVPVGEARMSS